MNPDACTSFDCLQFGCDYCAKCSHALFFGEGIAPNGKVWMWEFSPYFGPRFMRKDGNELKRQPPGRNKIAWKLFEDWLEKHQGRIKEEGDSIK